MQLRGGPIQAQLVGPLFSGDNTDSFCQIMFSEGPFGGHSILR
jgi:hypothetical protein